MQATSAKTILITGATDGIGLATAKLLVSLGHQVLIHGRNPDKLKKVAEQLTTPNTAYPVATYVADLSKTADIQALAQNIMAEHQQLDVLLNNAGIFRTPMTETEDGLDIRFMVNTIAPYLLTNLLTSVLNANSRVINLSSAAQAPINLRAFKGEAKLADMDAYAQSKLAITIWSQYFAKHNQDNGPVMIAVNPRSLLASKMVKEGFGVAGSDISIGAKILKKLALDEEFKQSSGLYFDNDSGQFSLPHPDALNPTIVEQVIGAIETVTMQLTSKA
ncbi:SDR family NAD(P)-dependent oxidoreductase [Paraglaciecola aquimarina]|uniref:SDR family NAD(P)-dependent oxidoreductase n=1 Tax=Paraglaciecola aquimarina TaxID=1235557 RepID=A0ABU3SWA4_9ALTE|nr:SDR family NAD(P)-dependent oxidoreductase [Paraglaciecola aquimarina]MDU0354279.1 SDR family NAD(P)-dependent oxidoreductase [Paraglaciecola aquimarina]